MSATDYNLTRDEIRKRGEQAVLELGITLLAAFLTVKEAYDLPAPKFLMQYAHNRALIKEALT